jgi:hypothetical protein
MCCAKCGCVLLCFDILCNRDRDGQVFVEQTHVVRYYGQRDLSAAHVSWAQRLQVRSGCLGMHACVHVSGDARIFA